MYAAAGLERNTTAMAMSHFRPTRFSGMVSFIMASRCSAVPGSSFARPAGPRKAALSRFAGSASDHVRALVWLRVQKSESESPGTGLPPSPRGRQAGVRVALKASPLRELRESVTGTLPSRAAALLYELVHTFRPHANAVKTVVVQGVQ